MTRNEAPGLLRERGDGRRCSSSIAGGRHAVGGGVSMEVEVGGGVGGGEEHSSCALRAAAEVKSGIIRLASESRATDGEDGKNGQAQHSPLASLPTQSCSLLRITDIN